MQFTLLLLPLLVLQMRFPLSESAYNINVLRIQKGNQPRHRVKTRIISSLLLTVVGTKKGNNDRNFSAKLYATIIPVL
jgi:hypothetical protein